MSAAAASPKGFGFIIGVVTFFIVAAVLTEVDTYLGNTRSLPHINLGTKIGDAAQEYYTVTRVVDGDTLEIDYKGTKEKVRLLGINTPETVDPRKEVECFGKEADKRMRELAEGKRIYLEFDDSQSLRDTYDRLLAYVYLEDGQMINRKLIAEGYAYEYTFMLPYKYQKEFRDLATFAQENKRGLWADTTCKGTSSY